MDSKIRPLPKDTIKSIICSQVITSVSSIVKELVENSLDAGATIISVKLDKYGYDKLEVKDNGNGINADDMKIIAKPHTTSKLSSFEELENLAFYGFRGEALSSLCSMSDLSITTKAQNETLAFKYEFNSNGDIIQSTPVALQGGTCVSVANLFKNTPVRKQYYSNVRRRKNDLKRIEELVTAFAIIRPKLYISFLQDGATIFKKNSVDTTGNAVLSVFRESSKKMRECLKTSTEGSVHVWLPEKKYSSDQSCTRGSADRLFVFVNERPVIIKTAEKLIKKYFCAKNELSYGKYPVGVVMIKVDSHSIDVNLEPNKEKINLLKESAILSLLEAILIELYGEIDGTEVIRTPSVTLDGKPSSPKFPPSSIRDPIGCFGKSDYILNETTALDKENDQLASVADTNVIDAPFAEVARGEDNCDIHPAAKKVPLDNKISPVIRLDNDSNVIPTLNNAELASIFDIEDELAQTQNCDSFWNRENDPSAGDCSHKINLKPKSNNLPTVGDHSKNILIEKNGENYPPTGDYSKKIIENIKPSNGQVLIDCSNESLSEQNSKNKPTTNNDCKVNKFEFANLNLRVEKCPPNENAEIKGQKQILNNVSNISSNISNGNIFSDTVNHLNRTVLQSSEDSSSVPADAWSKGRIFSGGRNIQSVHILSTPKRPFSSLDTSTTSIGDGFNREVKQNSSKKPRLAPLRLNTVRSPAGANIKKPSSAFSLFAKDVRHDIFTENPGVNFTFVAQEISKRWKEIDRETRQAYEQKSLDDRSSSSPGIRAPKPRQNNSATDRSMDADTSIGNLQRILGPSTPQLTKRSSVGQDLGRQRPWKPKQLVVPFSMQDITKKCLKQGRNKIEDCIVGKLRNNVGWMLLNEGQICCLNAWRLNEIILYKSLMQNYEFNFSTLQEPIHFNESLTGVTEWNTLLSLEKTKQTFSNAYIVEDSRILCNGFQVILYPNADGIISSGEITDITSAVGFYGLADFCEVLRCLCKNIDASLSECRPLKLKKCIQDECIRMNKSSANIVDIETLSTKLATWRKQSNCDICLHSKPIVSPMFDLTTTLRS